MELLDAIYQRRAVRSYLDQPVENTVIEALLDAAILVFELQVCSWQEGGIFSLTEEKGTR